MHEQTSPAKFPSALLDWAGHRKGGVRRLFYDASGRPSGGVIRTGLLARLEGWAQSIGDGRDDTPRALLLVGGPGNGKTEAVEFAIEKIDAACGLEGKLVKTFAAQFLGNGEKRPPRIAVVEMGGLSNDRLPLELAIVQEGSATDSSFPEETAASLLVKELAQFALGKRNSLYLACVNRGVLDDALIHAADKQQQDVHKLLELVVRSVGMGTDVPSCWPLDGYPNVAVWPMDVESLIGGEADPGSPVSQLLKIATEPADWPIFGTCAAGTRCPFCSNRSQLSNDQYQSAFLRVLRWYELATGKRWSFRDLFSLVSFVFAGVPPDSIKDMAYDPCQWAGHLLALAGRQGGKQESLKLMAPYLLVAFQYQHALLGDWSAADARHIRSSLKSLQLESDPTLKGLYLFFARSKPSSMPATLAQQLSVLCEALDPALADPDTSVRLSSNTIISFRHLDVRFSQSISEGFYFIKKYHCLTPLETDLLESLANADALLAKDDTIRRDATAARYLRTVIRDFGCRLVRRSLGVRLGVVRDADILSDYQKVINGDPSLINDAVKQITNLLNTEGHFAVALNTTFGEPAPSPDRLAQLSTDKQKVKAAPPPKGIRPTPPLRFLTVGNGTAPQSIPLTYELFRSVRELAQGLVPASLPRSVVALLDTTRARMAGSIVRDEESLNGAEISLGLRPEVVAREVNEFLIRKKN